MLRFIIKSCAYLSGGKCLCWLVVDLHIYLNAIAEKFRSVQRCCNLVFLFRKCCDDSNEVFQQALSNRRMHGYTGCAGVTVTHFSFACWWGVVFCFGFVCVCVVFQVFFLVVFFKAALHVFNQSSVREEVERT